MLERAGAVLHANCARNFKSALQGGEKHLSFGVDLNGFGECVELPQLLLFRAKLGKLLRGQPVRLFLDVLIFGVGLGPFVVVHPFFLHLGECLEVLGEIGRDFGCFLLVGLRGLQLVCKSKQGV